MADEVVTEGSKEAHTVQAESLAVAPEVLGLVLAKPWRRLAAILIDVFVIGLLSLLSGPVLGIASGVMLAVLFGSKTPAPMALRFFRWICRGLGLAIVTLAVLALGHSSFTKNEKLNLDILQGAEDSAAVKTTVLIDQNASYGQLREATDELQKQVDDLKDEIKEERELGRSWLGRTRSFTGALGVTFGWTGVYFTLLAGLFNGRTLGKLLLGIRAVKTNGTPFTFFDGFVRQGGYLAGLGMGLLGFAKLLWEPNGQAVQDRIAATVVVKV